MSFFLLTKLLNLQKCVIIAHLEIIFQYHFVLDIVIYYKWYKNRFLEVNRSLDVNINVRCLCFLFHLVLMHQTKIQHQCRDLLFIAKEPPEPMCKAKIDVGFILDSSGSLRNDYQREKDFMKVLASSFGISPDGSRAGVVTFSYNAEHSIKLNDYDDLMSFNKAVDKIPLMGSTTRIDKALRLTQRELFSLSNGARPGIPKILVLLTDGSQTEDADAVDPGSIADELRAQGIKVLVIGIGGGVNQTELLHLGGGQANTFSAASFDELVSSSFIKKVMEKKCEVGKFRYSVWFV